MRRIERVLERGLWEENPGHLSKVFCSVGKNSLCREPLLSAQSRIYASFHPGDPVPCGVGIFLGSSGSC